MIIQSKNKYIFLIIITFLTVRLITTSIFNISLDEKWLFGLWQHINKNYLEDNLFFSILLFHAQPPIWNMILGFGVILENYIQLNLYVSLINTSISLIILYCSHHILKIFNFKKIQIFFIILFLIILSPSILFYENFASYAHFTCMLLFTLKLNFLKILRKYKLKYELQIYFYSSLLILTWSAYIIYFNLLIFLLLLPLILKNKRFIKSLIIFIVFFALGSSPSIKNKILFNIFSNSSWTGLNAAQATGYDREEWPLCSFNNDNMKEYNTEYKNFLKNKKFLNEKILNDYSYNDLGYIYKSINCDEKSKKHLLLNFSDITKQKIQRFIAVHAHLSFDFAFKPNNWTKNFSILEKLNNNFYFKVFVVIFFVTNYLFYIYLIINTFLKRNSDISCYFLIINLILYSYLLFVSFYGSTWEQERMRYTGYSFIFISASILWKKILLSYKKS